MPPLRMMALTALLTAVLLIVACDSPPRAVRPVIYANNDQAAVAMRTAPTILLVRIGEVRMIGRERSVAKPPGVGGPNAPTIPLHLARIGAEVLLTVHGQVRPSVEFYSWVWDSGSHGGPRLFHPTPGGIRLIFLRDEGGYLHTVGDYPSYDLELRSSWLPALLSSWKSEQMSGADPLVRLIALRLRAELEGVTEQQLREDFGEEGPRVNHHWVTDLGDLVRVAGPFFVVNQLDQLCLDARSPSARFAACWVTAGYFPGRCEAYQLARKATADGFREDFLARMFTSCKAVERYKVDDIRSGEAPRFGFYGASMAPQHRRETLRVFASAMDHEIQRTACGVAAATWEVRDLPECTRSLK